MDREMVMPLHIARGLVWEALQNVLDPALSMAPEDATLEELGLSTPVARHYFRTVLAERVAAAGYEIDLADIPDNATDTPIIIASVLPGRSTIRNPR